jgi:hypothetical protein
MKKLLIVAIIGIIVFFAVGKLQKKVKSGIDNHYSTVNSLIELEMSK